MKKFVIWLTIMILGVFLFTESIIIAYTSIDDLSLAFSIFSAIGVGMFVVGLLMSLIEAYRRKKEKS